jgi:ubiquinone/menaquinone biosynthesis C-methylase UbiE
MVSSHLEHLARIYSARHYPLYELLDRDMDPRGPEVLIELAGQYLGPGSRILDVGCRDAAHLIRLVQAHAAEGVGVDPIDWHLERARVAVKEAGLERRIEIVRGVVEEIEQPAESFDVVWCRDVLELVEGLRRGLAEMARVLKPTGRVLVYTSFATDLLEPKEAAMINGPLGNVPANMDMGYYGRGVSGCRSSDRA